MASFLSILFAFTLTTVVHGSGAIEDCAPGYCGHVEDDASLLQVQPAKLDHKAERALASEKRTIQTWGVRPFSTLAVDLGSGAILLLLIGLGLLGAKMSGKEWTPMMMFDIVVLCGCFGLLFIVVTHIFFEFGGVIPMKSWFAWHPVLMTLAFPVLMTLARWSYGVDDAWGLDDKPKRRNVHGVLMSLGAVAAFMGYVAIFIPHSKESTFFGYSFKNSQWSPSTLKIIHSIFGYFVILAALAQTAMGLAKYVYVSNGIKKFTFHGTLGKVILFGSAINMVTAALFWSWHVGVKICLIGLIIFTTVVSTQMPTVPYPNPQEEPKKMTTPQMISRDVFA